MTSARATGLILFVLVAGSAIGAPAFARPAAAQAGLVERAAGGPSIQVFAWGGSRLGVSVREVDSADIEREKLPGAWGAVVEEVRSGSPADKAGLKAGDVIVEYDGERVRSARQFARLVQETPDGRRVKAVVMRAGKRIEVELVPEAGEWPAFAARLDRELDRLRRDLELRIRPEIEWFRWRWEPLPPQPVRPRRLGVVVQDLSSQLAEYFGVTRGVLVASVTPGSAAERAGVKAGDVITAVDGVTVASAAALEREVARLVPGREFSLTIVRDRKSLTLKATLEGASPSTRRRVITL
jgi:serine protease Do